MRPKPGIESEEANFIAATIPRETGRQLLSSAFFNPQSKPRLAGIKSCVMPRQSTDQDRLEHGTIVESIILEGFHIGHRVCNPDRGEFMLTPRLYRAPPLSVVSMITLGALFFCLET